ncbi:XRE family transcriptional regulator [Mesorhizobium sp. M7A.F.Ca.CA.001.09.2.1]|uniref:Helix-turn-helix domain-containing protein n=1 Tax=Mesorhizobium ciceri TaxID=39645 RepID=A0AB38T887_9HYPH|nr:MULTISPECIES: helix-turn-helix transcriptional regulator [Mesorhizobium]RUY37064.1 XRE family transcriptional regulator [Mesorhizobium sp. M7A.F.Ca.CA.001.13.2.1]MCA0058053.1 helix-turn-helix domain-containing protein [Mesorhizobium sp. B261B1A]MDF3217932.1 helix-turn-helix transcriptional regulator [Mesorhizobium ciceri]RUY64339.1 XRE family transcriptional regulator [Mesorhizobium sp. M7A.F.Ca.CA.001.13.1.1]RUY73491.1 XRE family transcriptional regulator [Mesorhizobium sp. M7A.F.Ca.CA.001
MESVDDIARQFRAARALLDIRQDNVAELAKVSRQMVARIESADKSVPHDAIEKIWKAFEQKGVIFLEATDTYGPPVTLKRTKPKSSP